MDKNKKNKIIIFSILYFLVVGVGVYYFLFRPKSKPNALKLQLSNQQYNADLALQDNEDNKYNTYNSEEVVNSSDRMNEYFKQLKSTDNSKKSSGNLFSSGSEKDTTDFLGNPFDFNNTGNLEDDLYRQAQIQDSLNLLTLQERRRKSIYDLNDEINMPRLNPSGSLKNNSKTQANSGASKETTDAVNYNKYGEYDLDVNSSYPKNKNSSGSMSENKPIFYQDPMFQKNDPYYFHHPLDSSLSYQPLYPYTSDTIIWKQHANYSKSLDSLTEKEKNEFKKNPLPLNTTLQTEVNRNFAFKEREYPDNYFADFTESTMDEDLVDPYFFDHTPSRPQSLASNEVIGSTKAAVSKKIKKLCVCEVVGDQLVRTGRQIPIRVKEDCWVQNVGKLTKGTQFFAIATVTENRMNLDVRGIILNHRMYQFNWKLYDTDALDGIYIHNYNRALSIPTRTVKEIYNTVLKTYEAAAIAYAASAQASNGNIKPFELFTIDKFQESGLTELAVLALIKEIADAIENPAGVFLKNKYRLYLDISIQ